MLNEDFNTFKKNIETMFVEKVILIFLTYIYISFFIIYYKTYYFDNLFQIKFLNFFYPLHIKDYFI